MSLEPTTVYVRDLPIQIEGEFVEQEINEDFLISLCRQYANVDPLDVSIQTTINHNGFPCSYAYIQVKNRKDAVKLINTINFVKLNKSPVHLILFDDETQKVIRNEKGKLLVIHHLSPDIELSDLYNIFKKYGDVIDCDMSIDGNENSNDIAYVLFLKSESACQAMEKLEGASFDGHKPIHIEYDNQNVFFHKFVLPEEFNPKLIHKKKSSDESSSFSDNDLDMSSGSGSEDMDIPYNESKRNKALILENKELKKENESLKARVHELEKKLKKYTKKK